MSPNDLGIDSIYTIRTLHQHIVQLRKKIERNLSHPETIEIVHGIGYRNKG